MIEKEGRTSEVEAVCQLDVLWKVSEYRIPADSTIP